MNSLFSFKIKFYVNCLAVQILIIKKIIKKYKPKTLRISRSVNKKLIIKNDYFFSFFLKKFLKKENFQIISKIQLRKNDKRKISFVFKNFIFFLMNFSAPSIAFVSLPSISSLIILV